MMSKRKKIVLMIMQIATLVLISAALLAPTATKISHYVMAGGGTKVLGTNYGVIGTMGQGVVGSQGYSANYGACSGFWCGGLPQFQTYLPIILRN
jgi:putative copper export protein